MSQDAVSVATLIGSVLMLRITLPGAAETIGEFMAFCITLAQDRAIQLVPRELLFNALVVIARTAGPMLAITALLAVIATFAQTRMLVAFESIKPKFSKLNPISGVKNLFSLKKLVEVLKNTIKIAILLYIVYSSVRSLMDISERYMYADLGGACSHLFEAIISMFLKIIIAFVAVAALDFLYQHWSFEKDMRMSKQEVKEEYKQTEGDPQIKGRIRQLQRQMAQSRMMQQVPQADVIIRNPTHVAVALRYHPGEDAAPIVLAKGLDYLALRIVGVAEENDIVVIENRPLARALYAQTELNRMIPPDLYEAVADVMVYLYKLDRMQAPEDAVREESQ